ncbi:response regulator [Frankia umida]|nr:response regulator transcription factor [Frankia umida]
MTFPAGGAHPRPDPRPSHHPQPSRHPRSDEAGSPSEPAVRVLLVDDQALVRGGFRMILEARADIEVVGEAADGAAAVELAGRLRPDVILMDVRMPHLDGVEATRRIVDAGGSARIIILTTYDVDEYVFAALRAGASGFLLKDVRPADMVDAVRIVARGEALLAPTVTRRLLDHFLDTLPERPVRPPDLAALSEREVQVLRLVALALSNAEIAARLVLTEATVKSHVSAVLRKLGLRDRVQAVVCAYDAGLVRPRPRT